MTIILPRDITDVQTAEFFELLITPQPLAQPEKKQLTSLVFEVTLDTNILYTMSVSSTRCERTNTFSKRIQIRKLRALLSILSSK
jgi:hypothetical protein